MSQNKDFLRGKKPITFLDLFAGAGGISEGFLQSYTNDKYYDFILASDINKNCELTHKVRYNVQLGLDTKFITEDIMSDSFLEKIKKELKGQSIDVVTGGPSCQSFSLSGRRKRFDKRDNLFLHYLKVIRTLRPKYFVMENVKGLLTKDKGHFKDAIMSEIRSIIDDTEVNKLYTYLECMLKKQASSFVCDALLAKVRMEISDDKEAIKQKDLYFGYLEDQYRLLTSSIKYQVSKSDSNINTIRHGIKLLQRDEEREKIKALIINEKTTCNIDNDNFVLPINDFIGSMEDDAIINQILDSFDLVPDFDNHLDKVKEIKDIIKVYAMTLDETFNYISNYAKSDGTIEEYNDILKTIRLYQVDRPIVVMSANYGVPQNRERVLFIGCRKDQELIKDVPPTVKDDERVTIYEALHDLDFIGNGEAKTEYEEVDADKNLDPLIQKRLVDGPISKTKKAKTYAEWSKEGRITERFRFDNEPFYVRSEEDLDNKENYQFNQLFNHQTSLQAPDVKKRLDIIAKHGGYTEECKEELKEKKLESNKRNYTLLDPKGQSPTVVTMPDDFIHYSKHRAMTVREMARLQSFDDTFVFQGKRSTGGDKRKVEIPQYTLVGNAVPPLMARAIGNTILKVIK